jgi:hypothetical protein
VDSILGFPGLFGLSFQLPLLDVQLGPLGINLLLTVGEDVALIQRVKLSMASVSSI